MIKKLKNKKKLDYITQKIFSKILKVSFFVCVTPIHVKTNHICYKVCGTHKKIIFHKDRSNYSMKTHIYPMQWLIFDNETWICHKVLLEFAATNFTYYKQCSSTKYNGKFFLWHLKIYVRVNFLEWLYFI